MANGEEAGERVQASEAVFPAATTKRRPAEVAEETASLIARDFRPPKLMLEQPKVRIECKAKFWGYAIPT